MQPTCHSTFKVAFLAACLAGLTVSGVAQPTPAATVPSAVANPGTVSGPPVPMLGLAPVGANFSTLPAMLQGIISPEEYRTYVEFQQHLKDDPALKELNAKIVEVTKELHQLRAESSALREKLTSANPKIEAIRVKLMSAMRTHSGFGPTPMPVPATNNRPGQ